MRSGKRLLALAVVFVEAGRYAVEGHTRKKLKQQIGNEKVLGGKVVAVTEPTNMPEFRIQMQDVDNMLNVLQEISHRNCYGKPPKVLTKSGHQKITSPRRVLPRARE